MQQKHGGTYPQIIKKGNEGKIEYITKKYIGYGNKGKIKYDTEG